MGRELGACEDWRGVLVLEVAGVLVSAECILLEFRCGLAGCVFRVWTLE